jgi:hypothetical protein
MSKTKQGGMMGGGLALKAPPVATLYSTRTRIKTPTREGYNVYKAYKKKVQ